MIDEPDPLIELFIRDITRGDRRHDRACGHAEGHDRCGRHHPRRGPGHGRRRGRSAGDRRRRSRPIRTRRRATASCSRRSWSSAASRRSRSSSATRATARTSRYLRELMDNGSTIGMDRFGMEHVLPDERRVRTVVCAPRARVRRSHRPLARCRRLQPRDAAVVACAYGPAVADGHASRCTSSQRSGRPASPTRRSTQMMVGNPRRLLEVAA